MSLTMNTFTYFDVEISIFTGSKDNIQDVKIASLSSLKKGAKISQEFVPANK